MSSAPWTHRAPFDGGSSGIVTDSLRGIRSFNITNGKIASPSRPLVWKVGENVASCFRAPPIYRRWFSPHKVAKLGCSCGFYAYHSTGFDAYGGPLWGVIEGYGRVTVGSQGFRAQKAKILALAWKDEFRKGIPLPAGSSMAMAYGVQVHTLEWMSRGQRMLKDFFVLDKRYNAIPIFDSLSLMLAEFPLHNPTKEPS